MTPIQDYETIREDQTLYDAFKILDEAKSDNRPARRDLIVVDANGDFKGKVTMIDIFRALEPSYEKLNKSFEGNTLTKDFVLKAIKDFDLWLEPVKNLCERGAHIQIDKVMHKPEQVEYINETESLENALHKYVMDVHQPLIVINDEGTVTGVLRFEDLYRVISENMLTCRIT